MIQRMNEAAMPAKIFIKSAAASAARVPGTAVFMTTAADGIPHALLHNLKHNKVLHERILLLTVKIEDVPYVEEEKTFHLDPLGDGFFRLIIRYGFMQETDVPAALARVESCGPQFKMMDTSFFLARQTLIAGPEAGHGDLARASLRLDDAQRGKRDGLLQAAAQPGGRAGQPGRDLTPVFTGRLRRSSSPRPSRRATTAGCSNCGASTIRPSATRCRRTSPCFTTCRRDRGASCGRRLAMATAAPPPAATIAGILDLGGGTALRVESEALAAIRDELADAFHGLLTPQDQAPWRPHVTIQNKVEPKEARALQQRLGAGFVPRPLAIRGLAAWRYRGGPWQAIREWPFRR